MNKPIAVSLLVSLFLWCVLHAMQESSGGVRGGKWSGLTLLPDNRFQKRLSDDDSGQSTADRRRARIAEQEAARAAKEEAAKEEAAKGEAAASEASNSEQPSEAIPTE